MVVVDSCGWLEWFTDGKLADTYKEYLENPDDIIVPTIILYEVYKVLKREAGEENAITASGYMKNCVVIHLDENLAFAAADIALKEKLAMADAIIAAVSLANNCKIITSDSDLQNLENVIYIPKS